MIVCAAGAGGWMFGRKDACGWGFWLVCACNDKRREDMICVRSDGVGVGCVAACPPVGGASVDGWCCGGGRCRVTSRLGEGRWFGDAGNAVRLACVVVEVLVDVKYSLYNFALLSKRLKLIPILLRVLWRRATVQFLMLSSVLGETHRRCRGDLPGVMYGWDG